MGLTVSFLNFFSWSLFSICRGCRAGRLKRRAIATLVSNSRQPSVQMGYSGFLEQNVNKVTGNLHSEVSELNIHSDTSRRTTNFIVVERSPLLPTQKDRSPMLIFAMLMCELWSPKLLVYGNTSAPLIWIYLHSLKPGVMAYRMRDTPSY